jgi:amino acid permease
MFKILFSVGILSIPSVFSYVGAVPGALLLIGWGAFNAYSAFLLGAFKLRHPGIHVRLQSGKQHGC